MLTTPSAWESFQFRTNARYATIVKLTDGTDTWYLGDMEIDWGAIHVYGNLLSHTGIGHKIDVFSKKWAIGDFSATFANLPYRKNTNGNWIRPSDDLDSIVNREATVYLLCGEKATGLSDCLIRFKGYVEETPKFDENTITVKIIDRTDQFDMILPQNIMSDSFSGVPEDCENERIPLIYGSFDDFHSMDLGSTADRLGLAKGIPLTDDVPSDCIFSDHPVKSFSDLFSQIMNLENPFEFHVSKRTLYTDASGYAKCVMTGNGGRIKIRPKGTNTFNYSFQDQNKPLYPEKAYNENDSTSAIIRDNIDDDGTNIEGEGRWSFGWDDDDVQSAMVSLAAGTGGFTQLRFEYKAKNAVFQSPDAYMFMYYGISSDLRFPYTDDAFNIMTLDDTWRDIPINDSDNKIRDEKNQQYLLACRAVDDSGGNGTLNDNYIVHIYGLYLVIEGRIKDPGYLWGEIEGRMFGSWIDTSGRSNSYNQNDLIEDPAFIIESLLRDEINLTDSQIDMDSFDDAANSNVTARINITKAASANRIIRQLCEQSTFAFFYSAVDKAKLIPLNESSPTTDRTIPFSHIKQNSLKISISHPKVNKLTVQSRWQGQKGEYRDSDVVENGASQSTYGIKEYTVKWPNIAGTSREHIANHLVGDSGSLWAFEKAIIEFETFGFTNADLEIGDWIELDDETWDAQMKLYGASWSGWQFLVTELTQKQDGTRIKAVAI